MISPQYNVWQVAGSQKTVINFIHQGMQPFWKYIPGEIQLYRLKHIWVTVIHISGAKAESVQLGTGSTWGSRKSRYELEVEWAPLDKSPQQPVLCTPGVW